jgi:hypothetical protein
MYVQSEVFASSPRQGQGSFSFPLLSLSSSVDQLILRFSLAAAMRQTRERNENKSEEKKVGKIYMEKKMEDAIAKYIKDDKDMQNKDRGRVGVLIVYRRESILAIVVFPSQK